MSFSLVTRLALVRLQFPLDCAYSGGPWIPVAGGAVACLLSVAVTEALGNFNARGDRCLRGSRGESSEMNQP
jgi:hypothetical protein